MSHPLDEQRRTAKAHDLASLRRLEQDLLRTGWRLKGKTLRDWLSELILLPAYNYDLPYPPDVLRDAGLAAVPALVDALGTPRLDPHPRRDLQIRIQCVDVLTQIAPPPTCAIPALLETLHFPSSALRRRALWALAKLRPRPTPFAVRELLACLRDKADAETRAQAARTLTRLEGAPPPEVLLAALERLSDPFPFVRRYALRLLDRFPSPNPRLRTALEEQVILDDDNRFEALRVLMRFDAPRALAFLQEELERVDQPPRNEARIKRGGQALQLVTRLGAKAESLLPSLRRIQCADLAGTPVETAIDGIARDQLTQRAPPPRPPPSQDARARLLLGPLPPTTPQERPARALARWAMDLLPLGRELSVRLALAAARRVIGLWDAQHFLITSAREGLFALEAWVCEPNERTEAKALSDGYLIPSQFSAPDAFAAAWTLTYASFCLRSDEDRAARMNDAHRPEVEGDFLGAALYTACRALQGSSVVAITFSLGDTDEPSSLSAEQAVQEIRQALVSDVLPWILGTRDPVAELFERRRELLAPPAP